ncbi:MAG TPA: hypothetical protein VD927_00495 [Chryseosolibacter sp.]|nr:hypothetical protein [Chryseosolibacter sp.]
MTYITVYQWQSDGFDLIEASLLSILSGGYLVIILLITAAVGINWSIRATIREEVKPWHRGIQALILAAMSVVMFIILDSLFFFLVDNSVSADYGQALADLSAQQQKQLPGMEDFKNMPFALQNGIVTTVLALIGALMSMVVIRKDGELFSSADLSMR